MDPLHVEQGIIFDPLFFYCWEGHEGLHVISLATSLLPAVYIHSIWINKGLCAFWLPELFPVVPMGPAMELNEASMSINLHRSQPIFSRSFFSQDINGIPLFGPPRVWRWSQRGIYIDSSVYVSTDWDFHRERGGERWRKTGMFFLYLVQMPHRFVSGRERHTIDLKESAQRNLPPLAFKRPKSVTLKAPSSRASHPASREADVGSSATLSFGGKRNQPEHPQSTRPDGLQIKSRSIHATRELFSTPQDAMKQSKEV